VQSIKDERKRRDRLQENHRLQKRDKKEEHLGPSYRATAQGAGACHQDRASQPRLHSAISVHKAGPAGPRPYYLETAKQVAKHGML